MFIKTIRHLEKQRFNGKYGCIRSLTAKRNLVHLPSPEQSTHTHCSRARFEWPNPRCHVNENTEEIEKKKSSGTFVHYPHQIMAWAITVHKSQELNPFDKAASDGSAKFYTPGQTTYRRIDRVYV